MTSKELFVKKAAELGTTGLAVKLGCSKATVSQICNGKYKGNPEGWLQKADKIFGENAEVQCPVLGTISGITCRYHHGRANSYQGKATGNPATMKLYATCLTCEQGV